MKSGRLGKQQINENDSLVILKKHWSDIVLDVNECKVSNRDCQHQCKSTVVGSVFLCNEGFFLNGNGKKKFPKFFLLFSKNFLQNEILTQIIKTTQYMQIIYIK